MLFQRTGCTNRTDCFKGQAVQLGQDVSKDRPYQWDRLFQRTGRTNGTGCFKGQAVPMGQDVSRDRPYQRDRLFQRTGRTNRTGRFKQGFVNVPAVTKRKCHTNRTGLSMDRTLPTGQILPKGKRLANEAKGKDLPKRSSGLLGKTKETYQKGRAS